MRHGTYVVESRMLQVALRCCGRKHNKALVSRPWQWLNWKAPAMEIVYIRVARPWDEHVHAEGTGASIVTYDSDLLMVK